MKISKIASILPEIVAVESNNKVKIINKDELFFNYLLCEIDAISIHQIETRSLVKLKLRW